MTPTEEANELLGKCGIEACCPSNCHAVKAVAAALAEKDAEISQLKALNQTLWAALTPEKRHELNLEMK